MLRNPTCLALCTSLIFACSSTKLFAKNNPTAETEKEPADAALPAAAPYDKSQIGPQAGGRLVVTTNKVLTTAGRQVIVGGGRSDVAFNPDRRWLSVLNLREVQLIDIDSAKIVGEAPNKSESFKGIKFSPDGKRLYASTIGDKIGVFDVKTDGEL